MNTQSIFLKTITSFCFTLAMLAPLETMAQDALTAAEMREFITGNTLRGKTEKNIGYHVYHDSDGTMEGKVRGGRSKDSGIWEISDQHQYCRKWDSWRNGARDCFQIFRLDKNKYRLQAINRNYHGKFEILQGDPEQLKAN